MVLGESGLMAVCPRDERPRYARAAGRLAWPNGATSLLFSAEEPDRLRGKQHMKLWLDELAAWKEPDAFDQALLGLRLGAKPQAVVTTTPRPTKLIKQLVADPLSDRQSRLDLRQRPPSRAGVRRAHRRSATPAARSAARSCWPRSSRRRRARCGRGR